MKFLLIFSWVFLQTCKTAVDMPVEVSSDKMLGADISFLPELEAKGIRFSDQGKEQDGVIGRQCREVLSYASICCGITRADTDRRGKLGTDSVKSVVVWTEVENRP